jgi:thiol-disulfide isomerase/thioredoxin
VLVYADWCGWCQRLRPDWDEAVRKLGSSKDVPAGLSVVEIERDLAQAAPAGAGFATMDVIRSDPAFGPVPYIAALSAGGGSGRAVRHDGERTHGAIVQFVRDKCGRGSSSHTASSRRRAVSSSRGAPSLWR